jgi:hypothetical protein
MAKRKPRKKGRNEKERRIPRPRDPSGLILLHFSFQVDGYNIQFGGPTSASGRLHTPVCPWTRCKIPLSKHPMSYALMPSGPISRMAALSLLSLSRAFPHETPISRSNISFPVTATFQLALRACQPDQAIHHAIVLHPSTVLISPQITLLTLGQYTTGTAPFGCPHQLKVTGIPYAHQRRI